jgi:splicing factor 3A subunit 2
MSAFEQRVEVPNKSLQYLVVAGEPYETVAFRIPARLIDEDPERTFSHWDPDAGLLIIQVVYSQ